MILALLWNSIPEGFLLPRKWVKVRIVFTAMTDGTWARLKTCRNERCQKAFYDTSKNRSGAWCSMAGCGSRFKARAYRHRRAAHDV